MTKTPTTTLFHPQHGSAEVYAIRVPRDCAECGTRSPITYDQVGMMTEHPTCRACLTRLGWVACAQTPKEVN